VVVDTDEAYTELEREAHAIGRVDLDEPAKTIVNVYYC